MVIWIVLLMMTAAAVMAVLWPLSRHRAIASQVNPDTQFYRDQVAEIERDRERGLLLPEEAEAAKAEAGRRLLRATGSQDTDLTALGEPALRRRRAVSALALSAIPILALAIYGAYGSPHLLTEPPGARMQAGNAQSDLMAAVAQIEAHLAKNPQDGRGWEVIAPVYLRMGRVDEAVRAYDTAIRTLGPDPVRLSNYGEALVIAKDGIVSAEAQSVFEQALKLDAASPKARFYLARAAQQDGQIEKAKAAYAELLSLSPPDAPWIPFVRQELARLSAPVPENVAQIGPEAIAGMVASLAQRLEAQGGNPEEWGRLMRSYVVLGQRDKAVDTLKRAREALAKDAAGLNTVNMMAQELKLTDAGQ